MISPLLLLAIGLVMVIGGIVWLRMHAFLALALAAIVVGGLTPSIYLERHYLLEKEESVERAKELAGQSVGKRLADGFGRTCSKVGILVAMAAIIGTCLMESGAAIRIVRSALSVFGERRAPEAMAGSSFLLGIPVFFDTLFYLMVPLAKALALQTKRNYLLYVLAIVAGGAMTHSLVPPTPGPLLVAGELGVDLGRMIVGGLLVGSFGMAGAFAYARWYNRRNPMEVRSGEDSDKGKLLQFAQVKDSELPGLLFSLSPILLPVVLIAGNSFLQQISLEHQPGWFSSLKEFSALLGEKNLALSLGAVLALLLLGLLPGTGLVLVPGALRLLLLLVVGLFLLTERKFESF